jgi:hypothetical protein
MIELRMCEERLCRDVQHANSSTGVELNIIRSLRRFLAGSRASAPIGDLASDLTMAPPDDHVRRSLAGGLVGGSGAAVSCDRCLFSDAEGDASAAIRTAVLANVLKSTISWFHGADVRRLLFIPVTCQPSASSLGVNVALRTLGFMFVLGLLSMSLPAATGEVVFHRRDHGDQGDFNPNQVYNVRSYSDAQVS